MSLVEQALKQAGLSYPKGDLGLRARWRSVTVSSAGAVVGYELAIHAATSEAAPTRRDTTTQAIPERAPHQPDGEPWN
jgi:hypothetical protein